MHDMAITYQLTDINAMHVCSVGNISDISTAIAIYSSDSHNKS